MGPSVCFLKLLQPSTRAIPNLGPRIVKEDLKLLPRRCGGCRRPDGTRDWTVRNQSTLISTRYPKSQHKVRINRKPTVDIIRVADESISEGRARVTRINQHSFNQTLGGRPSVPVVTTAAAKVSHPVGENVQTQNLLDFNEQISSEMIRKLINSHVENRWTSVPNISEEVRWGRSMTHTYDANFFVNDVSDSIETLEVTPNNFNFADELFRDNSTGEKKELLDQTHSDLSLLSSPLSGFAHVDSAPPPETSDDVTVSVGQTSQKHKEKISASAKSKKKVVSSKKKTKAAPMAKKAKAALVAQKAKTVSSTLKVVKGATSSSKTKSKENQPSVKQHSGVQPSVEEIVHSKSNIGKVYTQALEEESVKDSVATMRKPANVKKKLQKKMKREEENKKHMKEIRRKGREASFNQSLAAYVSVCVNLGMLNRATHTLLYYRQCARHTTNNHVCYKITSVHPYNFVLMGHAQKGNFRKMEELLKCIHEDHITPDETTFSALLSCLGRQPESSANIKNIEKCLNAMEKAGIDVQSLLSNVDFLSDSYECTLKAVHRALPSFKPQEIVPPVVFDCNLVNKLNETVHSTKVSSPAHGVVTREQLAEWAEEQFAMEMKSELVINSIEKKEQSENADYYRKMLKLWEERWQKDLHNSFVTQLSVLKKSFFSNRLDKRMALYPYLVTLPPEDFVSIMMQEIHRIARGSDTFSFTKYSMYRRLGELVYNRFVVQYKKEVGVLDKLKTVYQDYLSWYLDNNRKDGVTYIPRVRWQELAASHGSGPNVEHGPVEWPNTVLVSLGKFMYSMILLKVTVWNPLHSEKNAYPALYEVERMKGYRVVDEIKPSPSLVELYQKAAKPTLTFESVVSPMVCPPIPWVSTKLGGYVLNNAKIVRLPHNAHQQKLRMEECGNQQLYPIMDSLNQLSTIPWKVNQPILDIIIELFNNKGCEELDIPQPPSECPEPKKIHPGMSNSEIHKIRRQRLEYEQRKNELHSLWCDALYKLSLAHHFRDRVFWFPHNMDFRGRVYPCPPHLNHLSSDVFRSVLQFARGEKLGPNGLRWLKLHLINLTGFVKRESVEDRLKYCEEALEDIFDSADEPLTGKRWWTKSDEPWQTLAACKELARAIRSGNPEEFVCHLPIHQDGSCNGLQHYAALGRDKIGAMSVNLAPSRVPQDVYSAVAALVEDERIKDANAGQEIARVLEGHVKRKVIKQTVMTTVYGVTRYGARLQIEKQLKALDHFPREHRWAASHYLVHKTFLCLEKMFTATKEIQNWFTDCAKIVSETRGENLEYVTPLGLPVVQPYSKYLGDQASITKLPTSFCLDSFTKPNVMKQKNAFPPNFIHSLDSSHMMLTSLNCQQAGITFVSVHDCFWTHASSVDTMSKICRDQFVALHKEPILEDLSKFLQKTFGLSHSDFAHDGSDLDSSKMKLNNVVCQVPQKGEFDITSVHDSVYFFS